MQDQNRAYFTRSLALLRKDKGWLKPLLVMAAASFVPIVGLLGVQGYALEWARLTAWGVDAAPKQKDVRIGECIKSGWRGFLGGIGYVLIGALINSLVTTIIGDNAVSDIIGLVVSLTASVVYVVAALRATIYQDFMAGYRFDRIWEMITRDPEGLFKILIINTVISFVIVLISTVLTTIVLLPVIFKWALALDDSTLATLDLEYIDAATMRYLFFGFVDAMASSAPWLTLITYIATVGGTFSTLINHTATGLWMRNFNVASWGASEDPLPMAAGLPASGYTTQPGYGQPTGYGYGQPYEQQAVPEQPYQAASPEAQQYWQPYGAEMTQSQPIENQPFVSQDQQFSTVEPIPSVESVPMVEPIPVPADVPTAEAAMVTPIVLPPLESEPQHEAVVTPIVVPSAPAQVEEVHTPDTAGYDRYGREVIEVVNLTDRQPSVIDSPTIDEVTESVQSEQEDNVVAPASVEPVQVEPIVLEDEAEEPTAVEPEVTTEPEVEPVAEESEPEAPTPVDDEPEEDDEPVLVQLTAVELDDNQQKLDDALSDETTES